MKTQKIFKLILVVLLLATFTAGCAVAPGTEDQPFSPVAMNVIMAIFIPLLAQVVKVYRERGGKKPPSWAINYGIFGFGVLFVLVFNGLGYFEGLGWPTADWSDPGLAIQAVSAWLVDLGAIAANFLATATLAYHILKPIVFERIPWLMTKSMIKSAKAELRG